ncbi:glycosyltransferase family 9 protein [Candidatus Margulisiibacteriota bacterium]
MKKLKILLVRPDAIGDVVLMIPLINTIKKNLPEAEIYTLQQEYTIPLLSQHPAVKEVIQDWKKQKGKIKSFADLFRYANYLRTYKFDVVIFSYLDFFYAFLMLLARIPIRIGDRNKILLRKFLTHPVKQDFRDLTRHEVEHNLDLFDKAKEVFSLTTIRFDLNMDLYPNKSSETEIKKLLPENKLIIGIHASTGGGNKPWLAAKYAELIDLVHRKTSFQVVLTGSGNKDSQLNDKIISSAQTEIIDLTNKTDLDTLMCLIRNCSAFIGTDTGPTHIAAALKIPVLIISPTKFVKSLRWGPWLTRNRIIGEPASCPYVCYPYLCERCICLDSIDPQNVFQKLVELIPVNKAGTTSKEKAEDKKRADNNLSIKQALLKQKRDWLASSVNIGFYISNPLNKHFDNLKNYLQILTERKINFFLICRKKAIAVALKNLLENAGPELKIFQDKIEVIPLISIAKLLKFISRNDINLIHLVPARSKLLWKYFIRQVTALKLYCPPAITGYDRIPENQEILLDEYLKSFHLNAQDSSN